MAARLAKARVRFEAVLLREKGVLLEGVLEAVSVGALFGLKSGEPSGVRLPVRGVRLIVEALLGDSRLGCGLDLLRKTQKVTRRWINF